MTTIEPSDDIGCAPTYLDDGLRAVWDELRADLAAETETVRSDRHVFELAVRLTARMRAGQLSAAEAVELRRALDSLGLSPAGRQRKVWAKLVPKVSTR
jgi:hypothetical protein